MKKKLFSLLLAGAMLFGFAACGGETGNGGNGEKDPNIEYGRYVEEEITPAGLVGNLQAISISGSRIDLIGVDYGSEETGWRQSYQMFTSTDGGTSWAETDMGWTQDYIYDDSVWEDPDFTAYTYINSMAMMDDGELLVSLSNYDMETYDSYTSFLKVDANGNTSEFEVPLAGPEEGVSVYAYDIQNLGNGRFYMNINRYRMYGDGMAVTSSMMDDQSIKGIFDYNTGEMVASLDYWNGYSYFVTDTAFYLQDWEKGYIAVDPMTGQQRPDLPVPDQEMLSRIPSGNMFNDANYTTDAEGNFYTVNGSGAWRIVADAEEPEQLMEAVNYSYGSPLAVLGSFTLGDNGDMYVAISINGEEGRLLRYTYDEDMPAKSSQHIEVYAVTDSPTVRMAMSEYRRQHPEVTLGYTYEYAQYEYSYGEEDSARTIDDIIQALNTQLLSGNGPDVLIMDELPLQSYIEKGVLEDLSSAVEGFGLIDQVVAPFYTGDKLYALPVTFGIPVVAGPADEIGQIGTLEDLVAAVEARPGKEPEEELDWENATEEEIEAYYERMSAYWNTYTDWADRPAFEFYYGNEVFDMFYQMSGPGVYSEKSGIDREALGQLLEMTKRVIDHYSLEWNDWWSYNQSMSYGSGGDGIMHAYYSSMTGLTNDRAALGYELMNSFQTLQELSYIPLYASYRYGTWDEEGNFIEPEDSPEIPKMGIQAAPGILEGTFAPGVIVAVTTTSSHKQEALDFVSAMLAPDVQDFDLGEGLPVVRASLDKRYNKYNTREQYIAEQGIEMVQVDLDALLNEFTTPFFSNTYLYDIISAAAEPYFAGEADLESVVGKIVTDTEMYFAERQ